MIELNNIQKVIDQSLVIDIASLVVEPGSIVAAVGPVERQGQHRAGPVDEQRGLIGHRRTLGGLRPREH